MPYVRGFLKVGRRQRPGRPDIGLPEGEHPVDPDYGVDEGGSESVWPGLPDHELPEPPPGIWPPLTPEHPWRPIGGRPEHPGQPLPRPPRPPGTPGQPLPDEPEVEPPMVLPPGAIWPPLPPDVHGKYLALVLIAGTPGYKYRYVVIDADAKPPHRPGHRPDQGLPEPPTAQPKRS